MDMIAQTPPDSEPVDTARIWVIRTRDPAFGDWDGLTAWLEADAAHLEAYESVLAQEAWLDDLYAAGGTAGHDESIRSEPVHFEPKRRTSAMAHRRRYAWGGAIAAAIAGVAGWVVLGSGRPQDISTAPGEHRTIALADGSQVILNGGTRITFDPDKPRVINLARGEALFDVRHDAADPFVVIAGETRLLDAGTVFNVVREDDSIDVAVAEGEVIYQPHRDAIHLNPGDALNRAGRTGKPVLRKAQAQAIGGWRSGRLHYDNAALADVARDLGRNLGQPVEATPDVRRLRFSGTLVVEGKAQDVLSRAGPLLGVQFVPTGNAWRMAPADAAQP